MSKGKYKGKYFQRSKIRQKYFFRNDKQQIRKNQNKFIEVF